MLYTFKNNKSDLGNVRFQCSCDTERVVAEQRNCPSCGKIVPRAVSVHGGPWISYQQYKIDGLQRVLEPGALDEVPAEKRQMIIKNVSEQIRRLEDGTWATKARESMGHLTRMQASDPERVPAEAEESEATQREFASRIQALREELEAAGESAAPTNLLEEMRNSGPRPRITWLEWERDPTRAVQRAVFAIFTHVPPETMTPLQRGLVHAWLYCQSMSGGGGHGQIFFNCAANGDDASIQMTVEALRAVFTPPHAAVFDKALERWRAKPQHFDEVETSDPKKHEAFVKDTFEPLCAEFRDLNDEASGIEPTLESCIIAYLRTHQEEFVEVEEKQ